MFIKQILWARSEQLRGQVLVTNHMFIKQVLWDRSEQLWEELSKQKTFVPPNCNFSENNDSVSRKKPNQKTA